MTKLRIRPRIYALIITAALLAILLSSCGQQQEESPAQAYSYTEQVPEEEPQTPEEVPEATPTPEPLYVFHDEIIESRILWFFETFFDRDIDELTEEDFDTLAGLRTFMFPTFRVPGITFYDIPKLFPELRQINLVIFQRDEENPATLDLSVLDEMQSLRSVEISTAAPLLCLDFTRRFSYLTIVYWDDAHLSDEINLVYASVLERDFIESRVNGRVRVYSRAIDGERVYELIVTDYNLSHDVWEQYETVLFISERRNGQYHYLQSVNVPGRLRYAFSGLILTDVTFNGQTDVLVNLGSFGMQGILRYAAILGDNGRYRLEESFSGIANPGLHTERERISSSWRGSSTSRGYEMYAYIDGEFVVTDQLYINFLRYTDEELYERYYAEGTLWELGSDRGHSEFGRGRTRDWYVYDSDPDAQIEETHSD